MELTLTGASLNSDSGGSSLPRNRHQSANTGTNTGTTAGTNANTSAPSSGQHQHQHQHQPQSQSHSHSHHSNTHQSSSSLNANANANASVNNNANASSAIAHAHTQGQKKKCCNKHGGCGSNAASAANNNYVDIKTIPKEKLTSNPNVLMNALIASIRGKGTFDTFTYLIQVILVFESTLNGNQPMNWGKKPDMAKIGDKNDCKSCLNHYSNDGQTIAHWCAKRKDDVRFLQYLVHNVKNIHINLPTVDDVGMKPIHWACTEGSIPNVAFILEHYLSTSANKSTSNNNLMGITENNSTNSLNVSPLEATDNENNAIDNDNINTNIINTLDKSKCTPLLIASQYGHADLVAFLIKRGANPYAIDNAGDTAFHWAAYKGSVSVCSLLLHLHCFHGNTSSNGTAGNEGVVEKGDLDVESNKSSSKNHSFYGSSRDLYGYLDLQDNFGQCPLHLASLRGNIDVVSYILEEAERFVDRKMMKSASSGVAGVSRTDSKLNIQNTDTHSLLQNDMSSTNIEQYPSMLLSLTDKNGKTPVGLAIKKKHTSTELLLRKYMDKHTTYNQSFVGKMKVTLSQFLSFKNWLLWTGLVSEGSGRPPKFIFWFVIVHLFIASCYEVFRYAPIVWMTQKNRFMGAGNDSEIEMDGDIGDSLRLGAEHMTLHYVTWFGIFMTWVTLYLVNQTDPGILVPSFSSNSSSSECDASSWGRISNCMQMLQHRIRSFVPIPMFISSFLNIVISCFCSVTTENKRIKREMNSLSAELRRQYEETLESFATTGSTGSDDNDGGKLKQKDRPLLCHSCHLSRPPRSKHCRVLNRCILLFDHHCPFVGTTIGLYNYRYFYLFLWAFTLSDILFTITGFLYWKHGSTTEAAADDSTKPPFELWTLLTVIYFSMYTLMSGGLAIYHTQLVRMNLTTNEHQNMYKYDYLKKTNDDGSVSFVNPFNQGLVRNFLSRFLPGKDSYTVPVAGAGKCKDGCCKDNNSSGIKHTSSSNKKTDDEGGEGMELVANMV